MRLLNFLFWVFTALVASPLRADDLLSDGKPLPAPAPDEKPEVFAAVDEIASLSVEPGQISLKNGVDYAQVVVTATLKEGIRADVTRMVKFELPGALAQVNSWGLLAAKADGEGELAVSLGPHRVKVPIKVSGTAPAPSAEAPSPSAPLDYIRDIQPVVSRLGCNAGTCHGSKEGKNGFKLSLRGYDAVFDLRALADDLAGRRINVAFPDSSVMLLKPTNAVPHEGGQVMTENSKYYGMLRQWIASGAKVDLKSPKVTRIEVFPKDPVVERIGARQQMRVVATYADGKSRDVTSEAFVDSGNMEVAKADKRGVVMTLRRGEAPVLARFEGAYAATTVTVMGDRTGFAWEEPPANNEIDRFVAAKLKRTKTSSSALCGDLEFVRRVYLDLVGLPPTPEEIRAFIADSRDSRWKRDTLVDKLIGSDGFIDHWTNKWCDLLQVNSKFLAREGAEKFRDWIRQQVASNTPYDQFCRAILTANGSNKDNPPASYFKILRTPEETMENTTHLWLATRFNCNKCHDHPFERWTQDQYYDMTAFFAQVGLDRDPASGDRNIGGTAVEGAKPLYEFVVDRKAGDTTHLRTGKVAPPRFPYPVKAEAKPEATRRETLAAWIASPDNQYFAKSYVNRLWGYLLGTGIIEPLDDIRAGNPPSNPELLDWLARQFIEHRFDSRHVLRLIAKSRTYQLSVQTNRWNEDDGINFSHAKARRLPAEVLFDTIYAATGAKSQFPGVPPGTRAGALADSEIKTADGFLNSLGKPPRESACECERSTELQLGPVMALISGPTVGDAISSPDNAISKLVRDKPNDREVVDELFLRFLGRPATQAEAKAAAGAMAEMEGQHQWLTTELQKYEAEIKPRQEAAEKARQTDIAAIKEEKIKYETELAPKLAEAEKQRQEKIAAAQSALNEVEKGLPAKLAAWEQQQKGQTGWTILEPKELASTLDKTKFEKLDDRSVFVTGPDKKQAYTLVAQATLPSLTGLRLEAMLDARLGAKGPGRSGGGNFVLSEIEAFWVPAGKEPQKIKFSDALATYSQQSYDVKTAIDGKNEGEPNGWAVYPEGAGKAQTAIFTCAQNGQPFALDQTGGMLKIVLNQQYPDGKHSLGRFRLSVTNAAPPLNFGIPTEILDVLSTLADQRNDKQKAALGAYFRTQDADVKAKEAALAEAKKPLPPDPKLEAINARLARAEQPFPMDPILLVMRRDVELSTSQLTNKRLAAAQDLAWALVNHSAFLFNR